MSNGKAIRSTVGAGPIRGDRDPTAAAMQPQHRAWDEMATNR
jgi:hypothetical protein